MNDRTILVTDDQILYFFEKVFSESKLSSDRFDYYCGITDDLERRAKEHNIDSYCDTMKFVSFEDAKYIEAKLAEMGFDCGKQVGNGTEKSIYVYMCFKNQDFKK